MKTLIFAHYDQFGIIRNDTVNFLNDAQSIFDKIYFISTNVNYFELQKLNSSITVIERENIGYDFFSYRIGIISLLDSMKGNIDHGYVTLMNSSFIILDASKFFVHIKKSFLDKNCITGITKSSEIKAHIQSYMITIPLKLFKNYEFFYWWQKMKPINDRNSVILNYEIGLSQKILDLGGKLLTTYKPIFFNLNFKIKNPCFNQPERLLNTVGIIKVQLIRDNPHTQNIKKIKGYFNKSKYTNEIYQQATQKKL